MIVVVPVREIKLNRPLIVYIELRHGLQSVADENHLAIAISRLNVTGAFYHRA